jgi:hypothetical protein
MKKLSIIIVVFLASSCEMVVDVDVPFDGEKLVVNSFVKPDSLWSASISLNRFILTADSLQHKRVENATVVVHDENGPVATLQHVGYGMYKSQTEKPQAGKEYTIHVSAPDYKSVGGKSMIPIAATITSVEIEKAVRDNKPTEIIKVKFPDRGDTKDFYHIRLERVEEYYYYDTDQIVSKLAPHPDVLSDNPQLNSQFVTVDGGLLVKDVLFNGKEAVVGMRMDYGYYPSYFSGIRVVLRSVSEEYYNYMATKELQDRTSGDPFAQPVNLYNNIADGFGIFAGLSSSTLEWSNPDQLAITEISPSFGKAGDIITITGQNFDPDSNAALGFNFSGPDGYSAFVHWSQITEVTDTQLKVVVPDGAISGKLMMYKGGKVAVSDIEFQIIN